MEIKSYTQLAHATSFGPIQGKRLNKALADLLSLHNRTYSVMGGVGFWTQRFGLSGDSPTREDVKAAQREFYDEFGGMTGKQTGEAVKWLEAKAEAISQTIKAEAMQEATA